MKYFIYSNDLGYDFNRNFYSGKTFVVNHEKYAVTGTIDEAKLYTKQHLAYRACESLNRNVTSFWEVGILEYNNGIYSVYDKDKHCICEFNKELN